MKLSVITTLYCSQPYLEEFYSRLKHTVEKLEVDREFIFVNDGSPDHSREQVLLFQQKDPDIVLIDLSRNFGHHQAIYTGLEYATGDLIFLIDCDLEEAPELLLPFWSELTSDGSLDVVYGVQSKRKGDFFERNLGNIFYRLINSMTKVNYPADTLTARLMKRSYVAAILSFKERTFDIWALFVLAGFNQKGIPAMKASKGSSTYSLQRKLAISIDIITSFSQRPLYLIFFLGLIWLLISLANISIILVKKWFFDIPVEGWSSIMASIWLIGGITTFMIGTVAIYLSKLFIEAKQRPVSIIRQVYKNKHESV